MDTKLLKKWRAEANKLFFKDLSVSFNNYLRFKIPELAVWEDYQGSVRSKQGNYWISYYEYETIRVNDLNSKLQKSYEYFVNHYMRYMTKEKTPL